MNASRFVYVQFATEKARRKHERALRRKNIFYYNIGRRITGVENDYRRAGIRHSGRLAESESYAGLQQARFS